MADTKTKPTTISVGDFINQNADEQIRKDCYTIIDIIAKATGKPPVMWGTAIIGFDSYHYKYESGHEGDICLIGFSPRKANLSLYVLGGFTGQEELLAKLGKHKTGKGCLYIKRLSDINLEVLEILIIASVKEKRRVHLNG